jgi:DNA modification methylase
MTSRSRVGYAGSMKAKRHQVATSAFPSVRPIVAKPLKSLARQRHGRTGFGIELIPPASLHPYRGNARTHSRRQIKEIARSIERFGFTNPVLVDGANQIIAGHGRVAAAQLLGMKSVPAIKLEHLSDAEKRAYVLADNKLAEKAGWDREILAIELQGLIDLDFDIELTGFDAPEIDFLLEVSGSAASDQVEDDFPSYEPRWSVTRPGDLWNLGTHRLACGDARKEATYRQLMQGEQAQFVFTDPPYNVPIEGNVSGLGRKRHRDFAMATGEMTSEEFTRLLREVFSNLVAHSSDGSIHDVCLDWRHIGEMLSAGRSVYGELKNLVVWNKTNAGMGSFYRSKYELVFIWKSGRGPHQNNFELGQFGRSRSNVWDYAGVNTFKSGRIEELAMHPTVKPVALVADAIKDCSRRGDIILDSFAGSGTTLIAAERVGRKGRVIEIDPRYCDVIIKRWQEYAGKAAIHAASEMSFEDLEEQARAAIERKETPDEQRARNWKRRSEQSKGSRKE